MTEFVNAVSGYNESRGVAEKSADITDAAMDDLVSKYG